MSKKRLSSFTVKELGAAIKPDLENLIGGSLKPLETGEITHVNDSEIILNKFKIEVSEDEFVPYTPYLDGRRKGLIYGFVLGLITLPLSYTLLHLAANQWRDKNATTSNLSTKPATLPKPVRKSTPPTLTPPRLIPSKPADSLAPITDSSDDFNDTLSPSGLPMQQPSQPPELNDADFEN